MLYCRHRLWRLTPILLALLLLGCGQKVHSQLNLNFELIKDGYPKHWFSLGSPNYRVYADSTTFHSGDYSVRIESDPHATQRFKALIMMLPQSYEGTEITVSAYIKTENVQDGFAGLMIRLDPGVAYHAMEGSGITGTTNWTKYEISLPLQPVRTSSIAIGGYLAGTGQMWLDDFQVFVDGKNIHTIIEELLPADLDSEFDDGSSIPIYNADVQNLALLGKVWGFLKYYHPSIAKGRLNWDYELLRFLPTYTQVKSDSERDAALLDWIEKIGPMPAVEASSRDRDVLIEPDHSWMESDVLSRPLKEKLLFIYKNRDQRYDHYYLGSDPESSSPIFKNERAYADITFPNPEFRLLALFRYWNIINYFFPYKSQIDKNWDEVLSYYIPKFLECRTELDYEITTTRLIAEVGDSHAKLWGGGDQIMALRGYHFPPLQVRFIEGQLVVAELHSSYSRDSIALRVGDIITHINGEKVSVIADSLIQIIPGSRVTVRMRDVAKEILRSYRNSVQLTYIRGDKSLNTVLNLIRLNSDNIVSMYNWRADESIFKRLTEHIGYINVPALSNEDIPRLIDSISNIEGIIIDLRFGKQFDVDLLAPYFIQKPSEYVRISRFNRQNIGEFYLLKPFQLTNSREHYTGKVVILVDENTQSSAEWATMAFSVGNSVTVIGSPTAGTDGNMTNINLPGGMSTSISGIGVYYPDGRITQRTGLTPDIIVYPTIEGVRNGKDEILEKALKEMDYLRKKSN